MTTYQSRAVWELCRQGLQTSAYRAVSKWERGDPYHLDDGVKVPRGVMFLIERCNRQVKHGARHLA